MPSRADVARVADGANPAPRTYLRGFGAPCGVMDRDSTGGVQNIHPCVHARVVLWYGANSSSPRSNAHQGKFLWLINVGSGLTIPPSLLQRDQRSFHPGPSGMPSCRGRREACA